MWCALVLLLCALTVPAGSAIGRPARHKRCALPRHARVLASSRLAVVYLAFSSSEAEDAPAVGCWRPTGRRTTIAYQVRSTQPVLESLVGLVRLSGPFVAAQRVSASPGHLGNLGGIDAYDLRSHKLVSCIDAKDTAFLELAVGEGGETAWITTASDFSTTPSAAAAASVHSNDASGPRVLEQGTTGRFSQLRIRHHVLTWQSAGQQRSLTLSPPAHATRNCTST